MNDFNASSNTFHRFIAIDLPTFEALAAREKLAAEVCQAQDSQPITAVACNRCFSVDPSGSMTGRSCSMTAQEEREQDLEEFAVRLQQQEEVKTLSTLLDLSIFVSLELWKPVVPVS